MSVDITSVSMFMSVQRRRMDLVGHSRSISGNANKDDIRSGEVAGSKETFTRSRPTPSGKDSARMAARRAESRPPEKSTYTDASS